MSDHIDCLAFQASLTCNSGTREPAPPRKPTFAEVAERFSMDRLLHGLENIQRTLCSYDGFGCSPRDNGPPRICDCKYGADDEPKNIAKGHGYACGCCELRQAIALIVAANGDAAEIATLREQLADADRTLSGFVRAVREARECIVAIREMADSIDAMPSTAAFAIRETCDRWLNPPLAAAPAARVLTREEGQS